MNYYEFFGNSRGAIIRGKQIKNMSGQSKIELIMKGNPLMRDLHEEIAGRIPDKPELQKRNGLCLQEFQKNQKMEQ
jgi:hypothetical protein